MMSIPLQYSRLSQCSALNFVRVYNVGSKRTYLSISTTSKEVRTLVSTTI
uniref:Uncharacterized protein n=1 Tax=Anguilla anguilla TaxID=7936 RepID=A0A0E9PAX8_ANGAN